jgi:hypothetical protein
VATTREKISALVDEVRLMDPAEADPQTRGLIEVSQIAAGFGLDLLGMILPQSDAEADTQVDSLITLLFQVRGDDLPPYDFDRHVRDATATDSA